MCSQDRRHFKHFCAVLASPMNKKNRAKPMSELASAMFSIADASEFRFARFYIVCEGVMLGTLKSPIIICGSSDTSRGLSKRGKDTEPDAKCGTEEMLGFFSKESAPARSIRNNKML